MGSNLHALVANEFGPAEHLGRDAIWARQLLTHGLSEEEGSLQELVFITDTWLSG
jgi:hypothetical protein